MQNQKDLEYEMKKGILSWYEFQKNTTALCVQDNGSITDILWKQGIRVVNATIRETAREAFLNLHAGSFDYVIAIGVLENCYEPGKMLGRWKHVLKEDGKFLLGTNNRLGIRYFCGDRDPFTNRSFEGVENYRRRDLNAVRSMGGRCYARYEIEAMLDEAGFSRRKFYSVLPDLNAPQLIYAEDYLPQEDLSMRYLPLYHHPDSVFLYEEHLYASLIQNGLFHRMANSYLVECSQADDFSEVDQITLSVDRGPERAFATMLQKDGRAVKKALYPQGKKKLQQLSEHMQDLEAHGISVVDGRLQDDTYTMPCLSAKLGNNYMQEVLLRDPEEFIRLMDHFRDLILQSSEHIRETELGVILKRGYVDLVPLNCFYENGDFIFFDQEFFEEEYPANVILYRAIVIVYDSDTTREHILPPAFFWKRYGMEEHLSLWQELSNSFIDRIHNQQEWAAFHDMHKRSWQCVDYNRERINDDSSYYKDRFLDSCFESVSDKKIFVFGAGKYADKFLAFYKDELMVSGILDNNASKWGLEFRGVRIASPEILLQNDPDSYKVIVCVKGYRPIVKQLLRMGVRNIGIYDMYHVYPGRQKELPPGKPDTEEKPRKYHIGYIAGVFDLFHIGHLNMFRRAKEQCDYLIAAVVSDDGVRNNKKREPYIPFEERIEMVRACRYVDEAVEIPYLYGGTVDAYQKYHFDCQFSGSDYINDPWWLEQRDYLQEHGADLIFFSYTQQTSSTKIKALIEKGLL